MENQAATKAQIVKALKAMLRDLTHGDEVKGANKVREFRRVPDVISHNELICSSVTFPRYFLGTRKSCWV